MAPYLISLYWKKLSRAGAWAGMLGGFLTACPPVVCQLFFPDASTAFGKIADLGPHFACLATVSYTHLAVYKRQVYRRLNDIPSSWGTAVNVQAMVFGNMGETSGTGVALSLIHISIVLNRMWRTLT